MIKYIIKGIAVALLVGTTVSCSSDFLDDPKPKDSISPDVVFGSKEGANAFLSGILRLQRISLINDEASGLHSILFARSVKGADLIQKQIWFSNDYDYQVNISTQTRAKFSWRLPYKIIDQVNNFIVGVESSTSFSAEDKDELIGQALALRGYYYFQLAIEFGEAYLSSQSSAYPPIYTSPSTTPNPFSTKEEFFDRIVTDLEEANTRLGSNRINKSYINKSVAQAFLAQVYQYMGKWKLAQENALAAYGGNIGKVLNAEEYTNGFDSMNATEWLWALPQTPDQTVYYRSHPHAMMDHVAIAYHGTFINDNFVKLFSATDVRNLFSNFYEKPEGDWQAYVTSKFKFTFEADLPVIRYPELILIEAEAAYHLGDEKRAIELLDYLRQNRDIAAKVTTTSGESLLEAILLERRKELYGECGVEWFDAKRLLRGITRTGNHRTLISLPAEDKRFQLPIPQEELDARN
ncbi:RagB/SusD family nutrient uptake outer membrane protein [Myroides pelagicus]|uniref:RagB/SusD family nutrient uptake outer membrane protein n=1 Tax=Myroides pelagicus TaxID=270914 RepID=A0A7K1GMU6_9FLAO|nr:RagB/SusD family nutrient uptake outer membrane protein [Myroides pelagicus]MTH30128.1 RagB/SusD family nutrient uptake outer membrane protein [Myroides pelagicus]